MPNITTAAARAMLSRIAEYGCESKEDIAAVPSLLADLIEAREQVEKLRAALKEALAVEQNDGQDWQPWAEKARAALATEKTMIRSLLSALTGLDAEHLDRLLGIFAAAFILFVILPEVVHAAMIWLAY